MPRSTRLRQGRDTRHPAADDEKIRVGSRFARGVCAVAMLVPFSFSVW